MITLDAADGKETTTVLTGNDAMCQRDSASSSAGEWVANEVTSEQYKDRVD